MDNVPNVAMLRAMLRSSSLNIFAMRAIALRAIALRVPAIIRAMAWLILSGLMFVSFTGIVRWIASDLPPVEAAFIRYAFGLFILIPLFWRGGSTAMGPRARNSNWSS